MVGSRSPYTLQVWAYEENDECSYVQDLFSMMHSLFSLDFGSLNLIQSPNMIEVSPNPLFMQSYALGILLILVNVTAYQNQKSELVLFGLCFGLISYLYFLATKKNTRFQVSDVVLSSC